MINSTTTCESDKLPMAESQDVPIADIVIGDRREVDQDKVNVLAESIKEIGLQHPIGSTEDLRLIHGRHRIEAYRILDWRTIPALIHHLDELRTLTVYWS